MFIYYILENSFLYIKLYNVFGTPLGNTSHCAITAFLALNVKEGYAS